MFSRAGQLVMRFAAPAALPAMARPAFGRELVTSMTLPVAVSLVESGVVGVLATMVFDVTNMQLATISAAPMFANLTSFLWARLARGRRKVPLITALQLTALATVGLIAALPVNAVGASLLVALVVIARCVMAGVVTLRSIVWRHNYPRHARGRITGRLAMVVALVLIVAPLTGSLLLNDNPMSFRIFYPLGALIGLIGAVSFSRLRLRGERALLAFERRPGVRPQPHGEAAPVYEYDDPAVARTPRRAPAAWHVLRTDPMFRTYMAWQFLAGVSNMMVEPVLIKIAAERTAHLESAFTVSMLITQVLPAGLMLATLPMWSGLLDRMHIARFRVLQAWLWVAAQVAMGVGALLTGSLLGALIALGIGRALLGAARGGGVLAWNLGHNDFASREMVAVYMGIHATLTGVRGAFAPFLGMALFGLIGGWVFFVASTLSALALLGFWRLHRHMLRNRLGPVAD